MVDFGKFGESFMKFRGGVEDVLTTHPIKLNLGRGRTFESDPTKLPGSAHKKNAAEKARQEATKRMLDIKKLQRELGITSPKVKFELAPRTAAEMQIGKEFKPPTIESGVEETSGFPSTEEIIKKAESLGLEITDIDPKTGAIKKFGKKKDVTTTTNKAEKEKKVELFTKAKTALAGDLNSLVATVDSRETAIAKLSEQIAAISDAVESFGLSAVQEEKLMADIRKAQGLIHKKLVGEGKEGIFGPAKEPGRIGSFFGEKPGVEGF